MGPEAIFEPYKILKESGEEAVGDINFGNSNYIVINSDCENPEAVLKLVNFFAYMMDDAAGNETPEFIGSLYDNSYPNIPLH